MSSFLDKNGVSYLWNKILSYVSSNYAQKSHTHTKSQITDFPTIPSKTSELTNDSGFITKDNNTTYSLSKSGSTITLTASDGTKTEVTDSDTKYSHPTYTARTGVPTANQAPAFGGTFTVSQPTSDSTGHVTAINSRTITIPNSVATETDAGLMSAADKVKLDTVEANANNYAHPTHTAKSSGLYKVTVDSQGHVSGTTAVAKSDITALGIPGSDTTYGTATSSTAGLVKIGYTESGKNYPVELNSSGQMFVNVPWTDNNTVYTHPTYTAKNAGLYKVTVDGTGHVSAATAVAKSDITALGIPAQDTTYSAATTSAAGLMSASDKSKLDGIATGANKTTVDSSFSATSTNPVQNKVVKAALDGKSNTGHTHTAAEVGADAAGSASTALTNAKDYTDEKIALLLNNSSEAVDSIMELATAMEENADVVAALEEAIGTKAAASDLTAHINDTANPHGVTKAQVGLGNVENKSSATIRGELTKANVTTALGYTPPTQDTVYTHPTTSGNKHIPSGGSSGQILRWSADGTAAWGADNNTTYSVVSTTADGLAPKRDGSTTKFLRADGTWAVPPDNNTVYTHPSYTAKSAGLYKVTVDSTGHVSATTAVAKSDITALGIPAQDTTYSAMTGATSSAAGTAGLVPAPAAGKQASFLRGDGTWVVPTNTTYTNASLGQGYGTCATAAATTAKVVTLSSYSLTTGGVVAVKFTYAVPAGATMNINSKGAKNIYYKGKAIVDGVICAGEVATFIYDGTQYHLLSVDRNRFFNSLVPYGTQITASESATVDLNTVTYLKVGNYFCSANAQAKYVSNIPVVGTAFMMTVSSPLSQTVDDETGTWKYRLRRLTYYQGDEYVQYCYSNGTAGNWTYGAWEKIIKSTDTATTSNAGAMSAADKTKLNALNVYLVLDE